MKESVVNRRYPLSLSFPRHVPANFEFLIGQRDIYSRFSLSLRFFFPVRAIPTDWLGHFTSLLSENFVEKSVALLSGHVYIISRRA